MEVLEDLHNLAYHEFILQRVVMNRHIPGSWQHEYYRQILTELDQEARSVLCLKACEGFTDDELRGVNLNSKFAAMKQQRDELLAALVCCKDLLEFINRARGLHSPSETLEKASAAIAKVGG